MEFVFVVLNWELKMGFPLLAFFLVSHLLVIHSSGSCPSSFNCRGPLDPIKSPSTDYTNSLYLLCTVSCDEPVPKVIWGGIPNRVSNTTRNTTHGTMKINYPALKINCDFSGYTPRFYDTPFVSFTISPNLTIFKCNTSNPKLKREADDYFHENHNTYDGCEGGYTVYYPRPNDEVQHLTRGSPPTTCQLFQLPSVDDGAGDPSDLFSLLTSNFSVEYHLSDKCLTCLDDGGQCLRHYPREFQCSNETGAPTHPPTHAPDSEYDVAGRKRLGLILGTGANPGP